MPVPSVQVINEEPGHGLMGSALVVNGVSLWGGVGVPPNGLGQNGDFFFRLDGTAANSMYQKRAGAWVAGGP